MSVHLARTFTDERGTGTFHSLGVLPKRRHPPVFHIHRDDDNDDDDHPHSVPFPRSTSPVSPSPPPTPPRPPLSRGSSTPILLSTGKPLKPSLKSSPSSPTISKPREAQHLHLRACSEPGIPAKNVHFPEKDYGLATVRLFSRSARPTAVSNPAFGNGDETETEGEDTPPAFPFPPAPPVLNYEIDPTKSSCVPCKNFSPHIILESLHLSPCSSRLTMKLSLTGSILVPNLAFEKNVAVRFTLDDWQTVSEVCANHVVSLPLLSSHIQPPSHASITSHLGARGWDRFTFTVRLDDYAHSLSTRTLWLASRYRVDSTYPESGSAQFGPGGEWWDNNDGNNYRVAFRPAVTTPTFTRGKPRRETISGTVTFRSCRPGSTQSQIPEPIAPLHVRPPASIPCKDRTSHSLASSVFSKAIVNEADKRCIPLRTGRLSLSNYAPPTVATALSVPLPSTRSPQNSSPSPITDSDVADSAVPRLTSHSDEDTASPASSTLSTPSVSPTMTPHIINGQPATVVQPHRLREEDEVTSFKPGHIADWDWSASSDKLRCDIEGLRRHRADLDSVPGLVDLPERQHRRATPQGRRSLASNSPSSKSIYDAFVTQWCFAQGPPPGRGYGDGGIMA